MLTWSQRFRLREWFKASLWVIPAVFVLVAALLADWIPYIDRTVELPEPPFVYSAGSAQELLSAIASGMIAFTGFVFSILLLVVQFGSSAFTPRLLRSFSTDQTIKVALGVFVATFIYALLVLSEVAPQGTEYVPQYAVNFSVIMVVASIIMFLRLIADVTRLLRVAHVVADIGRQARRIIEATYPDPVTEPDRGKYELPAVDESPRLVTNPGRGGVVQALDSDGIAEMLGSTSAVVQMLPAVGEFVPHGRPIFRVTGEMSSKLDRALLDSIALGDERTMRQDPAFALRILVDIASKALSPGINDPTTAVQAIDQIGEILFALGGRRLPDGVYRDPAGEVRFVYRTPTWEEYVDLAFTEIRTYGADSPQVVRSLHGVLHGLREAVPSWRVHALDREIRILEQAAVRAAE